MVSLEFKMALKWCGKNLTLQLNPEIIINGKLSFDQFLKKGILVRFFNGFFEKLSQKFFRTASLWLPVKDFSEVLKD